MKRPRKKARFHEEIYPLCRKGMRKIGSERGTGATKSIVSRAVGSFRPTVHALLAI
jgi:hypothetical protein